MIDWHSHILPGIDDGSRDVNESISMLAAFESQGVDMVIATPHFYANDESVRSFLNRRQQSYELLCSQRGEGRIHILSGAEVKYYSGISRMDGLEKLTIENTNLLLLEMPISKWTNLVRQELQDLINTRGLRIILAHIERYLEWQDVEVFQQLCESGARMQVNASFLDRLTSRKKATKLLNAGVIHFIGSDCHNMTTRPPKINSAYELIRKKFGEDYTSQMIEYGYHVLGHS